LDVITIEELHQNNGIIKPKVFIAIKNMVFDVSN